MRRRVISGLVAPGAIAALIAAGGASAASADPDAGAGAGAAHPTAARPTLVGWAELPAETYVPGSEPSGSALGTEPVNGVRPPFPGQPVQGVSGVVRNADGSFLALADNGYGRKETSADFLLRVHRLEPDFRHGRVRASGGGITLSDPDGQVRFPLTRPDRVLTGADFDPESIVRAPDGTFWIGEEFGPYVLHFDRAGRLLERPIPVPGAKSPGSPELEPGEKPNLGGSKGLENLAISPDGGTLYPMLEGTVTGDTPGDLRVYEFDRRRAAFTGRRWTYRMQTPELSVADLIGVGRGRFLAIERDQLQGDKAAVKKIHLVDLPDRPDRDGNGDGDGLADKTEVVDLLNIANPRGLGTPGRVFRFPFFTIEAVTVFDDRTIGVLNDNNFPFDATRVAGRADDTEFIKVRLPRPLPRRA
ncbi:esterase-like activity of phytase family protein [Actinomadura sp. 9N215]|uniref:esterase-like activity of phytase family protein n=1 Tax=Actinomadura sp. 9N215 TaxID=3375150 RepID=UPI0037B82E16